MKRFCFHIKTPNVSLALDLRQRRLPFAAALAYCTVRRRWWAWRGELLDFPQLFTVALQLRLVFTFL